MGSRLTPIGSIHNLPKRYDLAYDSECSDGTEYSNYIGGLQSTTTPNSYSETFTGELNYFEWTTKKYNN